MLINIVSMGLKKGRITSSARMIFYILIGNTLLFIGKISSLNPVCVLKNDKIDLVCNVDSHNTTITWLGPDNDVYAVGTEAKKSFLDVTEMKIGSQKNSIMRLNNFTVESEGTYKCFVQNVTQTHKLILKDIFVNITAIPSGIVDKGSSLVLDCEYDSRDSNKILQWRKDGQNIIQNQSKLVFQYIKVTDAGEYQCNLFTCNNNLSSSIKVVVNYDTYSIGGMYGIAAGVVALIVVIAITVAIVIIVKCRAKDDLTNKTTITAVSTELVLPMSTDKIRPGISIGDNYSLVKDIVDKDTINLDKDKSMSKADKSNIGLAYTDVSYDRAPEGHNIRIRAIED